MRVLVVRVGALGDVLHALPSVAALRKARPGWEIDWVVDPRWSPLLVEGEGMESRGPGPVVDRVHLAETRLWKARPWSMATLRSVWRLRKALRARRYEVAVDMQGTLRAAVIAWMSGAKTVVGYAHPRERAATRFYARRVLRRGAHVVEQGAALLGEACRVVLTPADVALPREEWAENWAEQEVVVRRPMCVLGAGGGWGAKQWPAARYGELAVELHEMGFDVVVNAARKDDAVAAKVVATSGGAARVVVCNVTGLIALMRRADLMVGGDSGPTHLAAALGVPVVALFGPTSPARNGPWGPGVLRVLRDEASVTSYKRTSETEVGLRRMAVGTVVEAVRKLVGLGLD